MIKNRQRRTAGRSRDIHQAFLQRVHELLLLGYHRMDAASLVRREEPELTGELAKEMDAVLRQSRKRWARFFNVHDEKPVNNGKSLGKHRRRIDIYVQSSEHRPRLQFSFEAKRLHNAASVGAYLGKEGLGNFLEGHKAAGEPEAGMLGCVQAGEPDEWAARLAARLQAPGNPHCVLEEGRWRPHRFARGPAHCYFTAHRRKVHVPIGIYHTLLVFH